MTQPRDPFGPPDPTSGPPQGPPPWGQPPPPPQPPYGHQPPQGPPPGYGPPPPGAPPAYGAPAGYGDQPAYPPPPPGYGGYGYGAPPHDPQSRPGLVTASLVLGILGFFVITGLLAVVFGVIGRRQAKQRGQRGTTMAAWGIALGLLLGGGAVAAGVVGALQDDFTDLERGDCIKTLSTGSDLRDLEIVDCSDLHEAEVFATFTSSEDGDYPGVSDLLDEGQDLCSTQVDAVDESKVEAGQRPLVVYPDRDAWEDQGVRKLVCLVAGDPTTGSVLD